MISNYLFWLAIILLSWSGFCINTSVNNFNGTKQTLKNVVQWVGFAGLVAGLIRTIMLCIHFNWWWLLGITIGFFIIIGAISALFRGFAAIIVSAIGIVAIPILWWVGGLF